MFQNNNTFLDFNVLFVIVEGVKQINWVKSLNEIPSLMQQIYCIILIDMDNRKTIYIYTTLG